MCTVTFLPISDGYILTSNRDEWKLRKPALHPKLYEIAGQAVYFPKDQQAGGTWVAAGINHTLCLLNGAFTKHQSNPPYRLSRGIMVLDFFTYDDIDSFCSEYDFHGIENFTLLMINSKSLRLREIRWDGEQIVSSEKDTSQKHIWSSSTLYTDEIIIERKNWFSDWQIENPSYDSADIIHFHRFGGKGDQYNDVLMEREEGVKTLSITSIKHTSAEHSICYLDLQTAEKSELKINGDGILNH